MACLWFSQMSLTGNESYKRKKEFSQSWRWGTKSTDQFNSVLLRKRERKTPALSTDSKDMFFIFLFLLFLPAPSFWMFSSFSSSYYSTMVRKEELQNVTRRWKRRMGVGGERRTLKQTYTVAASTGQVYRPACKAAAIGSGWPIPFSTGFNVLFQPSGSRWVMVTDKGTSQSTASFSLGF